MKLDLFKKFQIFSLFILISFDFCVYCQLAEIRFPIKNIDFSKVKFNKSALTYNNPVENTEFKSSILFDNISIHRTEFNLNKFYDNLTLLFGKQSTSWILAKQVDSNLIDVYVSRNNGINYSKCNLNHSLKDSISLFNIQINDIFINTIQPEMIVFTDVSNKHLIVSSDDGISLKHYKLEFTPEFIYYTKNMPTLIGIDASNKQLWVSKDMGKNWQLISNSILKVITNNLLVDDLKYLYFIQQNKNVKQLIKLNLVDFNHSSDSELKTIINEDIEDFIYFNEYQFLITKSKMNDSMELSILQDENNLMKTSFVFPQTPIKVMKFDIALVSKFEIFIAVVYKNNLKEVKKDLFVSNTENFSLFKLSLPDLIYDEKDFKMLSLNNQHNVYMVNAKLSNGLVATFIKSSKMLEWTETKPENDLKRNCHLELKENFIFVHKEPASSFITEPYPDLMIATDLDSSNVYVSEEQGKEWTKILDDNYFYSTSFDQDLKNIIVAVKKNELVNSVIYSQDEGNSWNEYKFSKKNVFANGLFIEPSEHSARFFLFCTKANKRSKALFTFEFKTDLAEISEGIDDQEFDVTGQFDIQPLKNIQPLKIDFSLALSSNLKLNSFLVKIISYYNLNQLNGKNYEIVDLDESIPSDIIIESTGDIKTEQYIKTTENHLELSDMKSATEYHCYFYANLTSLNTRETRTLLLEKKIILKTHKSNIMFTNLAFIVYFFMFIGILMPILIWLLIDRKIICNTNFQTTISKYEPVTVKKSQIYNQNNLISTKQHSIYITDDKQILVENAEYSDY